MSSERGPGSTAGAPFAPTQWTAIFLAADETPEGRVALENLCQIYWPPIYAFVRRQGHSPHEAQDLTQGFILQLLERKSIADVEPAKGKFRSFLLAALKNFLANEWDKTQAQKRGGGQMIISLDEMAVESAGDFDLPDNVTPEKAFERRWAESLLEVTLSRLEKDYADDGKERLFQGLKSTLTESRSDIPYAEIAQKLGMSEGSIRVAVHRLRQRYREILRMEIANTVSTPEEVNEELRNLFAALNN